MAVSNSNFSADSIPTSVSIIICVINLEMLLKIELNSRMLNAGFFLPIMMPR